MTNEKIKDELIHYRTKGSKNGVRRYQNKDGSYTALGKAQDRYNSYVPVGEHVKKVVKDTVDRAKNATTSAVKSAKDSLKESIATIKKEHEEEQQAAKEKKEKATASIEYYRNLHKNRKFGEKDLPLPVQTKGVLSGLMPKASDMQSELKRGDDRKRNLFVSKVSSEELQERINHLNAEKALKLAIEADQKAKRGLIDGIAGKVNRAKYENAYMESSKYSTEELKNITDRLKLETAYYNATNNKDYFVNDLNGTNYLLNQGGKTGERWYKKPDSQNSTKLLKEYNESYDQWNNNEEAASLSKKVEKLSKKAQKALKNNDIEKAEKLSNKVEKLTERAAKLTGKDANKTQVSLLKKSVEEAKKKEKEFENQNDSSTSNSTQPTNDAKAQSLGALMRARAVQQAQAKSDSVYVNANKNYEYSFTKGSNKIYWNPDGTYTIIGNDGVKSTGQIFSDSGQKAKFDRKSPNEQRRFIEEQLKKKL